MIVRPKIVTAIYAAIFLALPTATKAAADQMILIGPGRPDPVIVISAHPTAAEKYAAEELSSYLEKITNRKINIVDDEQKTPADAKVIALGRNKLTNSIDASELGVEQYILDVQPDKLVIVGGYRSAMPGRPERDAGTLYGVYDLLETLGVRWYRPEPWGEHVPKSDKIILTTERKTSPKPSYAMRSMMGGGMSYFREESPEETDRALVWLVRHRLNNALPGTDFAGAARFGGMEGQATGAHSWQVAISAAEYFDSHPEYFALVNGKRVPNDLCPGNPEVQKLYAAKLIARAKENPNLASLSTEPDDCMGGSCECPLCRALDGPSNPHDQGQASNRVTAFGNTVARMVAKEVPWMKIQWLAYATHTGAPNNVKQLEPNSIIMLAPINGWDNWTKKLMDPSCRNNAAFVQITRDWAALKPSSMMTFLYGGYGWPGPLPITRTVADRMREYRTLGIEGNYNSGVVSWGPQSLDFYMTANLFWNPDLDLEKELDLYYTNYYGPAAKPMKAYHERLMKAVAESKTPVTSGGRGMHLLFTPALVNELGTSIAEARALVKDKPLYERRLYGVAAGYEFARRISEILSLKKKTGSISVKVPEAELLALPPDIARPAFTGSGSYLQSEDAESAYRHLVIWMRSVNQEDAVFDMTRNFKDDAAKIIFAKRGHKFGSSFLTYLAMDVLTNNMFQHLREEELLKEF